MRAVDLFAAKRFLFLASLIISPLVIQEGRSCFCFSAPLCSQLPNPGGKRAIFVGTVIDVFPGSLDIYGLPKLAFDEGDPGWLARHKISILQIWRGVLSTDEEISVSLAESPERLRRASDMSMYARRIRFRVQEWLVGTESEEFELFTESTDCGYSFQIGKEYFVVSDRHSEANRWWTGACSRTAPLDSVDAQEDLKAVRTWRDGQLAPRVYGQIWDMRQQPEVRALPGARVRVQSASIDQEAASDAEGRFAFDNLAPAKYRIEITAPIAVGSPQELDLSRGGCFEADIFIELDGAGTQYKILGSGAPQANLTSPGLGRPIHQRPYN